MPRKLKVVDVEPIEEQNNNIEITNNDNAEIIIEETKPEENINNTNKEIKDIIEENIGKVKLTESWANISREDNRYGFHTHKRDITAVYYLKNNYTNYGTQIDDKVIIPGLENSVLIFDGKINHSIINMPFELAVHPHNNRYSVVFDYDTI